VWDVTSDLKFSVELLLPGGEYAGLFFPKVDTSTPLSANIWNNTGTLSLTVPLNAAQWTHSRLFAQGNGQAYYQIAAFINTNFAAFTMQPVHVVHTTTASPGMAASGSVEKLGNVVVPSTDTYSYLNTILTYAASIGCSMSSVLPFDRTTYSVLTTQAFVTNKPFIRMDLASPARTAALKWFASMRTCAEEKVTASHGISDYVFNLKGCYSSNGDTAFLYRSPTTVWAVSLGTVTVKNALQTSPFINRLRQPFPTASSIVLDITFTAQDKWMYGISFLLLAVYVLAGLSHRLLCKGRRRVSLHGEEAAKEAAVAIRDLAEGGHLQLSANDEIMGDIIADLVYLEKKERAWTFKKWWYGMNNGGNSSNKKEDDTTEVTLGSTDLNKSKQLKRDVTADLRATVAELLQFPRENYAAPQTQAQGDLAGNRYRSKSAGVRRGDTASRADRANSIYMPHSSNVTAQALHKGNKAGGEVSNPLQQQRQQASAPAPAATGSGSEAAATPSNSTPVKEGGGGNATAGSSATPTTPGAAEAEGVENPVPAQSRDSTPACAPEKKQENDSAGTDLHLPAKDASPVAVAVAVAVTEADADAPAAALAPAAEVDAEEDI